MKDRTLAPQEILEVTESLAKEIENPGYDCKGFDPMMCIITGRCLAQPDQECRSKKESETS